MLARDLNNARNAFKTGDIEMLKDSHKSKVNQIVQKKDKDQLLEHKEEHKKGGEFMKSAVFGGVDGIITTFAVISAGQGANLSIGIILILGISNMFTDSISMGLGDYLSSKAENEQNAQERKREEWEVENNFEGEKQEMIEIYVEKGMSQENAVKMVDVISKYKDAFVDIMMVEELGIIENADDQPIKNAMVTTVSFILFGLIPQLSYIVGYIGKINEQDDIFYASIVITIMGLFFLGASKSTFTPKTWYLSGIETVFVGVFSAIFSYLISWLIESILE